MAEKLAKFPKGSFLIKIFGKDETEEVWRRSEVPLAEGDLLVGVRCG